MIGSLRRRLLISYLAIVAIFVGGVAATLLLIGGIGERTRLLVDRYWQDNNLIADTHDLLSEVTLFLSLSPEDPDIPAIQKQLEQKIGSLAEQIAASTFRDEFRREQVDQLLQIKTSMAGPADVLTRLDRQTAAANALLTELVEEARRRRRDDVARDLSISGLAYRDYYITANPSDLEIFRQQLERLVKLPLPGGLPGQIRQFRTDGEAVFNLRWELRESREQLRAQVRTLSESLKTRTDLYAERVIYPTREEILTRLSFIPNVLLAAVIVSAVAALAISLWMSRRISRPLERAVAALRRIEEGDLAASVEIPGGDELDLLGRAVNSLAASLRQTLADLHHTVEQLGASEERYRQIAEQLQLLGQIINGSPTLAFLCSATPGYPVRFVSDSLSQFGYQPADVLNKGVSILELVHPEDRARLDRMISRQLAAHADAEFLMEFRIMTRQGEVRWVDGRMLVQRDDRGVAVRLQGVLLDITEKIHLREQATQSSRLVSLGELAAGVAHEINNPNATILLNTKVLSDITEDMLRLLDHLAPEKGDLMIGRMPYGRLRGEIPRLQAEVLEAAVRIRRIVDELRQFVLVAPPELRQDFDLNEVAQAAVRLTMKAIKKATGQFDAIYAPELPRLQGYPQRLEQVVVNLLMNACQALPDRQRRIDVRTGCSTDGSALWLEVEDQGVGIAADDLPHVKDPFFTTRREKGGTGLGLSISTRIVKEHHGQIEINSTAGRGTIVRVVLPLPKEQLS